MISARPTRVLVVEDDPDQSKLLLHGLAREGYAVSAVECARTALYRLTLEPFDAILCDLNLPGGMRGDEFLRHVRSLSSTMAFVMLTGERDLVTAVESVKDGADDYIPKPCPPSRVAARLASALHQRRMRREEEQRVRRAAHAEFLGHYHAVRALVNSLEAKDPYTRDHSRKVAACTMVMTREMGLDPRAMRVIRVGALLHDIGKIGVPLTVLHKEGPLDDAEWEIVKKHTTDGAHIVAPLARLMPEVQPIVRHEHERWDGKGYPDGIAGTDIPLGSRLIMFADTYDAVCSDRPYRKARSRAEALEIVREGAGTQFDPNLVSVFERSIDRFPYPRP